MIDPRAIRAAQMIARNVMRRGYEDGGAPTVDDSAAPDVSNMMGGDYPTFTPDQANRTMAALGQTWPVQLAKSIYSGATLPGDVYAGRVDPMSDEGIARTQDLAQLGMSGGLAGVEARSGETVLGSGPVRKALDLTAEGPSPVEQANKVITAYHGSPHDFEQFDLSKIGTGEGAQAYGHGLYFAESEPVAKSYRDQLAKDMYYSPDGQMFDPQSQLQHMNIRVAARNNGPDLDSTIARAQQLLPKATEQTKPMIEHDLSVLQSFKDAGGISKNPGHMYEVEIAADPEHFLDWDKSLSEQHPVVRQALGDLGVHGEIPEYYDGMPLQGGARLQVWDDPDFGQKYAMVMPNGGGRFALTRTEVENLSGPIGQEYTGKGAISKLSGELGGNHEVTNRLRQAGIPGIKYLDAGSRGAGDGSRNYVVFDQNLINVKRKYEHGGYAAMPHPVIDRALALTRGLRS